MTAPKRLFRRSADGRLGGVCAGLAEYFEADVTLVRLLWIVFSIVPGAFVGGLVAYLAAWAIMPDAAGPAPAVDDHRLTRSMTDRKIAGVCGGFAEYFRLDPTAVRVAWALLTVFPGWIVFGVVAYVVAWFIMPAQRVLKGSEDFST